MEKRLSHMTDRKVIGIGILVILFGVFAVWYFVSLITSSALY